MSIIKIAAQDPNHLIPELLRCLDHNDRDWAANVVLYSVSGRDALLLSGFEGKPAEWRKTQKAIDRRYWEKWWKENREHMTWNGKHYEITAPK